VQDAFERRLRVLQLRSMRVVRSDRDMVKFLFYRVCFGLLHSFYPDELPCGWMAPDADQMEASRSQPVGAGDLNREYYRTHASARC
jgi:hypothetical protein